MKKVAGGFLGAIVGLIVGYGAVLFGWIGYTELFGVVDRDGGKIMGIAFVVAPAAALVCAVVGGIMCARWAGKAPRAS